MNPFDNIESEVAAMLAKITPMTPEQARERDFNTFILPVLVEAGFDKRACKDDLLNSGMDSRNHAQRKAARECVAFLKDTGAVVALVGPRGTGKTSIAAQIVQKWAWADHLGYMAGKGVGRRRMVIYEKTTGLISKLKAMYADFGTIEMDRMERRLNALVKAELLILDELHEVSEDSKHKDRILTDIVDRRYAADRDTILISNQTSKEFKATINPSIMSRMQEHGGVIPCEWPSFREQTAV